MRNWSTRRWSVAAGASVVVALGIGAPTGIVPTGVFTRMTPVIWWDYPGWAISAQLLGLTAATYMRAGEPAFPEHDRSRRTLGATLLSTAAVACPVCNKIVVALIGVSGALNYWAPLQPVIGRAKHLAPDHRLDRATTRPDCLRVACRLMRHPGARASPDDATPAGGGAPGRAARPGWIRQGRDGFLGGGPKPVSGLDRAGTSRAGVRRWQGVRDGRVGRAMVCGYDGAPGSAMPACRGRC